MAKQFKIYLSKSEELVKETFEIEIGKETVSIRRFEIELLKSLYMISSNFQTVIPDSIKCKDVVDQLKNIADDNTFIELTKNDIEYGKTGWEKTAGHRPYSWTHTGESILTQLYTPFDPEVEVEWDSKLNKFKEK